MAWGSEPQLAHWLPTDLPSSSLALSLLCALCTECFCLFW